MNKEELRGSPVFYEILEIMAEVHHKKQHDYAQEDNPFSNFEFAARSTNVDVDIVFRVMLGIKEARLVELLDSGKKPNNEAILDTLIDHAVYSVLRAAYYETQRRAQISQD